MSSMEVEEIELSLDSSSKFNCGVEMVASIGVSFSCDDTTLEYGQRGKKVSEFGGVDIAARVRKQKPISLKSYSSLGPLTFGCHSESPGGVRIEGTLL